MGLEILPAAAHPHSRYCEVTLSDYQQLVLAMPEITTRVVTFR